MSYPIKIHLDTEYIRQLCSKAGLAKFSYVEGNIFGKMISVGDLFGKIKAAGNFLQTNKLVLLQEHSVYSKILVSFWKLFTKLNDKTRIMTFTTALAHSKALTNNCFLELVLEFKQFKKLQR